MVDKDRVTFSLGFQLVENRIMNKITKIIVAVAICLGVGYSSSIVTSSAILDWYPTLVKPSFLWGPWEPVMFRAFVDCWRTWCPHVLYSAAQLAFSILSWWKTSRGRFLDSREFIATVPGPLSAFLGGTIMGLGYHFSGMAPVMIPVEVSQPLQHSYLYPRLLFAEISIQLRSDAESHHLCILWSGA